MVGSAARYSLMGSDPKRYVPFWIEANGNRTMPRLTKATPKYRKHKASGQAIVTLSGVDFYLGPHGTKASKREYDRVVGEWLECGRRLPAQKDEITVVELAARYWRFATHHYVKNGKPTDEQHCIKAALKPLRELYGRTKVSGFGPLGSAKK